MAQTQGNRQLKWLLTVLRAGEAYLAGQLEDCEALANEALSHQFRGNDENAAHVFGAQLLLIRREQGRLDELAEVVEGVASQYPEFPNWRCALAYLYAQLNRRAQARRELEALARSAFEDLPRDTFWLSTVSMLCEVVVFLGDAVRAQLLYELLLPYADRCAVISNLCQGSMSRPLGLLATTMSRFDDATLHFEQALRMNAQIRSPLWIAHTKHDYARMLLLRNHSDDRGTALELLNQALATAEKLGLKALSEEVQLLTQTAEGDACTPPLLRPD